MPQAVIDQFDYKELAKAMLAQNMTATTTKAATATYGHGRGGLFSGTGRERPIFSAMALPANGLQAMLPVRKTDTTDPLYDILTGVTATTGSEPSDVCGTFPAAGLAKLCTHSFVLGLQGRSTKVYDLTRIGERQNRGEFLDYQFYGDPFTNVGGANPNVPTMGSMFGNNVANTEEAKALFELAVAWSRDFSRDFYTGSPANNDGAHKYFYGLDYLINVGYRDAETGVACIAADSKLIDFHSNQVANSAADLVRNVTGLYVYLQHLAVQVGLAPVKWVISMPWAMFYEITEVWPCAYQTYRCQTEGTSTQFVDSTKLTEMRDKMRGDMDARTGQYLLINGQPVPVVLEDSITETVGANGVRTSQMYFVPLTVLGGTPVTYMEYFDFSAPNAGEKFARDRGFTNFKTSDDGRFFWVAQPSTGYCVSVQAVTRTRVLLLTPHLAGRVFNISYAPLIAQRSPFPGDTYFYNGGKTDRIGLGQNFYTPIA